jgi:hypothetical protein
LNGRLNCLLQLSHINDIFSSQELADVSESEFDYAKSLYTEDYEDLQLTNTSLVNNTVAAALANMTYDELVFTEEAVSACGGNLTDIGNVTEMAVPEKQDGGKSDFLASISFGQPVDAFFCDASNNQVPDPVVSQGDTIRVCVRQNRNSSYFHLEDIHTLALTQPTSGVMSHYAVYNGNASAALTTKNCQLGLCNILFQVPSRFFDRAFDRDPGPIRIIGVALLNLGSDERRVLAPIEFSGHRQLQTSDVPRSAFELAAEILGTSLEPDLAPTNNSSKTSSDIGKACILALAAILTLVPVICLVFWRRRKQGASRTPCWRRRKQGASRTPSELLPMRFTPIMKMQEPPLRILSQYTYPEHSNPCPATARSA